MKALEIIEYFGAEEMVNNNTPFEEQDYAEAIKELEELENKFKREQENNLSSEIAKTETILGLKKYIEALENRSCEGCIYVDKSNCINCLSCKRQYSDNWRNK
jgi:predicted Zn-ribbon and HTH transcriptional regulator